tara:strand:- start:1387 stop:1575 length:189 start_codon:yes stop_codon:yes gene_type:complete
MLREHPFGFTQIPERVHFVPTVGIKKNGIKRKAAVRDHRLIILVHSACQNAPIQSFGDTLPT